MTDLISSFSDNAAVFAFQPNSQKDVIDLYPLDPNSNYQCKSSLVKTIDYEKDDLTLSDINFLSWITEISDTKNNSKRSRDDTLNGSNQKSTVFFVNVFNAGKIVVYSGNEIVNIIKNKNDIIGLATTGTSIWILDSEKTIKQFQYNSSKPLKSFHLIDGKDEDIMDFQMLEVNRDGPVHLGVVTEKCVYIIDPFEKIPSTLIKLSVFGCVSLKYLDSKHLIVADLDTIKIIELNDKIDDEPYNVIQVWDFKVEKIKIWGDNIVAFSTDNTIGVFNKNESSIKCVISAQKAEIIDFVVLDDQSIIVAWLNVNEPNFELIKLQDVNNESEIMITNKSLKDIQDSTNVTVTNKSLPEENTTKIQEEGDEEDKKYNKTEQREIANKLTELLENYTGKDDDNEILVSTKSDKWNEDLIRHYLIKNTNTGFLGKLYEILSGKITESPWSFDNTMHCKWLKWILILFNIDDYMSKANSMSAANKKKHFNNATLKSKRQLKSSLKNTTATLPLLLSIQGKLEMLISQAELRQEMGDLIVNDKSKDNGNKKANIDEELDNNTEEIAYVNGEENDEDVEKHFVDAE
ncbi:uncharacterized protein SCODWIG_03745 [Saccharomycodes ludwigii]|uniref:U3 small nucleolar RNA-associated protein 9 n=1 Tax=Saccharomycodes ludwigii TaxID=36035 RepID=A0A376BBQ8_9ASCO|nr:uncharacterized protein SCODWIG_03745 [Saccharomycodes ludwigii]